MDVNLAHVGDVTRHIGSTGFGRALFRLFADAFNIRFCYVVAFPPACGPRAMVSEGTTPRDCEAARKLALEYVKDCNRNVPKVAGRPATRTPAVYRVRTEDVMSARYRRRFFEEPQIGFQLVHLSAVDGVIYYLSLCRDDRARAFYAHDVTAMRGLSRFAIPAIHRHVDLDKETDRLPHGRPGTPAKPVSTLDTPAMRAHMRQVFLEAPHRLSPREAEVCAGIVLGYSTTAIGLNMQIAFNTVATHRKRAYKKLGVCTQNELFARYFDNIRGMHVAATRTAS